jgi:twinkle protein
MLKEGRIKEFVSAFWEAREFRPDGIVRMGDIRESILKPIDVSFPWFLDSLTKLTYGRRLGETYGFGAGTGIGKTDLLTQQVQYDVDVLNEKVGLFFLEQQPEETGKRVAGKFAKKRFHVPDGSWEQAELLEVIDRLDQDDRVFFYRNFGATDWNVIKGAIKYLAMAEGVRIFYLDHLTALAAAEEDEKKGLERIMADMALLAQSLQIIIHFVSHLATPDGKPHEEGGRVMIRNFKGSRAIGFWSHFMFGLERDQQNEDPAVASTTTFRVLKDRFTGQATGKIIYLGYDTATGLLYETQAPQERDASELLDDEPDVGGDY